MTLKRLAILMSILACVLVRAATARAADFTAAAHLSVYMSAGNSSVAIDGGGNVLATWYERADSYHAQINARTRPTGGAWSDVQALDFVATAPTIHATNAGAITAVWTDGSGTWAADLPLGGVWGQPQLIAPGRFYTRFAMNRQGDAVVAAQVGPWYQGSQIWTVRRVGGSWGAPVTIASTTTLTSGNALRFDGVAIAESGDSLVSWEAFQRTCHPKACASSDYILHATRASDPVTAAWSDSGALAAPSWLPQYSVPLLDGAGRAAVFFAPAANGPAYAGTVAVALQSKPALKWQAPRTAYAAENGHSEYVGGASADASGHATVVFVDSNGPLTTIVAADGNLHTGAWTPPIVLSAGTNGPSGSFLFRGNPAGGGIVEWTGMDAGIHVNTRKNASQAWSATQDIVPKTLLCGSVAAYCSMLNAVDINANGQAVASFTRVTSNSLASGSFTETTSVGAAVKDH